MIYVVDDTIEMCRSLEALLSTFGHEVRSFSDPAVFLSAAPTLAPGLVLLDLRLDGVSGLEVLAELKDQSSRLPVIIITAHGDVDLAVQAMKLGARDFIQKPFGDKVLIEKIEREAGALTSSGGEDQHDQDSLGNLTARERQVAEGLSRGLSNKQVADELGLSVRTVEMHRSRAMQRLGCRTFADFLRAILIARGLS